MSRKTIMMFFILFTLLLTACDQGEEAAEEPAAEPDVDATVAAAMSATQTAAPTVTSPPADTPIPATDTPPPAPSPTPTAESADVQTLNLNEAAVNFRPEERNFATELIFRLTVEDETASEFQINGVSNAAGSSSLTYDFSNVEAMPDIPPTDIIEQDNTTYITLPDGTCVSSDIGDIPVAEMALNTGAIVLETESMLAGQLTFNGVTEINGVTTNEYLIAPQNVVGDTGITNMTGGILNVAEDGNYVVRLILEGSGESELLAPGVEGDLYYELNLTPSETPFEITLPENCIAGGLNVGSGSEADSGSEGDTGDDSDSEDSGSGEAPVELVISQVSQNISHTCQGGDVVVEGASNTITLTGNCNQLIVNSAGNTINVDSAALIVINGGGNTITYGGSPAITDNGLANTLTQK